MAQTSHKRVLIDKANTTMVLVISIAVFLTIFSLVAGKALLAQWAFQGRVIKQKQTAVTQLKSNIAAVDNLIASYQAFAEAPENILEATSNGTGERDGDNTRIILDALPSKYDFPALTASVEKLLAGFSIQGITGVDDEVAQQTAASASAVPSPIEMPFTMTAKSSYAQVVPLLSTLERSIRPIHVKKIKFSGKDSELEALIEAKTYYQPEKNLEIPTKDVK